MYIEHLDVRSILRAKGNPFKRISQTVSDLKDDGIFELRTTFRPTPLYRVLGKKGFTHMTICLGKADYLTQFYRDNEQPRFVVDLRENAKTLTDSSFFDQNNNENNGQNNDQNKLNAEDILDAIKKSNEQAQVMVLRDDGVPRF